MTELLGSAAHLGLALAHNHFLGAYGEVIRVTQMEEVCKPAVGTDTAELWASALTLWVLAPARVDVFGRDQYKHQSWLLHCMKITGVLLGSRGFSSPGAAGDKLEFR